MKRAILYGIYAAIIIAALDFFGLGIISVRDIGIAFLCAVTFVIAYAVFHKVYRIIRKVAYFLGLAVTLILCVIPIVLIVAAISSY